MLVMLDKGEIFFKINQKMRIIIIIKVMVMVILILKVMVIIISKLLEFPNISSFFFQ